MMDVEFFLPMIPPTITDQMHTIGRNQKTGKPYIYKTSELKAARSKLCAHLARHTPAERMTGPVLLVVKWCFPIPATSKRRNGEYKTSKPDTDNLQKMLKDCMTETRFWGDDAQVVSEHVEKFWAATPGIYIHAMEIDPIAHVVQGDPAEGAGG